MKLLRAMAGFFVGVGGLMCIWFGVEEGNGYIFGAGTTLLGSMLTFFIGEKNGANNAKKEIADE